MAIKHGHLISLQCTMNYSVSPWQSIFSASEYFTASDIEVNQIKVCMLLCPWVYIFEPRHDKTCLRESPTRPDTNQPAQPQKLTRVLKFRLYNLEIYYLSSGQQRC